MYPTNRLFCKTVLKSKKCANFKQFGQLFVECNSA